MDVWVAVGCVGNGVKEGYGVAAMGDEVWVGMGVFVSVGVGVG